LKKKSYHETVWREEPFTFAEYSVPVFPHQNNGDSVYKKPLFDGRLHIAGTETSSVSPGYMDGAVGSAKRVAGSIIGQIKEPVLRISEFISS